MDVTLARPVDQPATAQRPPCFGQEVPHGAIRLCAACSINEACFEAYMVAADAGVALRIVQPTPVNGNNGKH